MASVWLARPEGGDPERYLAVKRVHPHLTSRADVRQMFLNEARILAHLDHPNICGILDYGVEDDSPYIVMQYLHGAPLSGLLRRLLDLGRPLPVDLMTYVVASTAEGLHYAHEAAGEDREPLNLVHRDISPQNIFVTFSGEVKLLDFGVAKAAGFDGLTRTGHVKGKYAYMSPEQAEGHEVDRRSDVFSLGIVLWEAFTGRHLFKRKRELETLQAIVAGVVPLPSVLNPEVPPELDRILQRTLQPRRERRYQSAGAFAEVLWSYLTTTVRPMGSDEVAEILRDVYADQPPPAEQALRMATEPEAPALVTSPGRLPLEDLEPSVIEEATAAALRAHAEEEEEEGDPLEAPTGSAPIPVPSGTDDLEGPPTEALLAARRPAGDSGELIAWNVERAEVAPTIADPKLSAQVQQALAESSFLDRPLLQPHPFDAGDEGQTLAPDHQETLMDHGPAPGVPQAEISDAPPELEDDGPRIMASPEPLTRPPPRPPIRSAPNQPAPTSDARGAPPVVIHRAGPSWGVAVALALAAATLVAVLFSLR